MVKIIFRKSKISGSLDEEDGFKESSKLWKRKIKMNSHFFFQKLCEEACITNKYHIISCQQYLKHGLHIILDVKEKKCMVKYIPASSDKK